MKYLYFGLILFLGPLFSSAHPGNTDMYGYHNCWTNCESWGVSYGIRHTHYISYAPSLPLTYDQLHELMKSSAGYKKISGGYKVYDIVTCKDGYTKTEEDKCKKEKNKRISLNSKPSLSNPANNERLRFIRAFENKLWFTLEDMSDKQLKKYKKEVLKYVPKEEIIKYAPDWFIVEYLK